MPEEKRKRTPLHALHGKLGARMVEFAGYDMPVQYETGIIAEHRQVRDSAGLFDVSHMGQVSLRSPDGPDAAAAALEALVPGDIRGLAEGQMRYTMLTNEKGGIIDDLMVTRRSHDLLVIVNAATRENDIAHLETHLKTVEIEELSDRALVALQGPKAVAALERHHPDVSHLSFLHAAAFEIAGAECWVSRSGYTGEDGFEISVPADAVEDFAQTLLDEPEVLPAGLGARDTLRLEAGLCLYGHDIDESTTPVEASLTWAVAKRRREEANFLGAEIILDQIEKGAPRKRVGLMLPGRAPAREGAAIRVDGEDVGTVTSGSFSPTLEKPIAMAYVPSEYAKKGTELAVHLRGRELAGHVTGMPFVEHRYVRNTA